MKPHACPHCRGTMMLRQTRALAQTGGQLTYHFLYCSQCGEGPDKAFTSAHEAIFSWNQLAAMAVQGVAEECLA